MIEKQLILLLNFESKLFSIKTSTTLFDLNEYLRRVVALNFSEAIWVSCEIAQINESRGHFYLELVEKSIESESLRAQAQAIIWNRTYKSLKKSRGKELDYLLQSGMEVLLQVRPDFHERFGLKLFIEDIDPTYTLGKLELKRREIIRKLKDANLLGKNREVTLPKVIQKVAVISSATAAGYQDYLQQLKNNEYQYAFTNRLFAAAMQGEFTEKEVLLQLKKIAKKAGDFDCVILIRGGGAKLDLAAFDSLTLGKAVANFPIPVFTGIGHDIDETVLDLVANRSLKTPTAVADFLIHHNLHFESTIAELGLFLKNEVQHILKNQELQLQQFSQFIEYQSHNVLSKEKQTLDFIEKDLPRTLKFTLEKEKNQLNNLENLCQFLSPEATLKRGFSLSLKNGKVVSDVTKLKKGETILTKFATGEIESKIEKIEKIKK